MKKKKSLFLLTLLSCTMLVGGTVAAYIVTDNADPFGIKITPGTLTETTTGSVTLEWGDTMNITNISDLAVGAHADRTITLKASGSSKDEQGTETAITTYTGSLALTLTDLSGKGNVANSLIHYLKVELMDGETVLATIPTNAAEFSLTHPAVGTPAGKAYTLRITLDQSASPVYKQIITDVVYLQVDWNKAATDGDEAKATTIYAANKPADWATVYAYAYKGSTMNHEWPGVEMKVDKETGFYTLDVLNSFEYVIFNDGTGKQLPAMGEAGYAVKDLAAKPYFDFADETWKESIENRAAYYLVGTMTGWDYYGAYAFTRNNGEGVTVEEYMLLGVELKAGTAFKVRSGNGQGGSNGYYGASADYVVAEDGVYDIYFRPSVNADWADNGSGGYFYVSKVTTPAA